LHRKFLAIAVAALLAALNQSCSNYSSDTDELWGAFAGNLNDPKLKERLAEDDGYAFALLYGADIHGSLETCG
jgi:hypothetical protein